MRRSRFPLVLSSVFVLAAGPHGLLGSVEPADEKLAAALSGAKVTLEQGLAAAAKVGDPISGKFEMEKENLQLSVYTSKGGAFSEVIVDHVTGKVLKSEAITEGDDYKNAMAQADALRAAKASLHDVVNRAVKANVGFRAVSVEAKAKDGKATAEIVLQRGRERRVVIEPLR